MESDGSAASISVPADFRREWLTEALLLALLNDAGVPTSGPVIESVAGLISRAQESDADVEQVVARAVPAVRGDNAYIAWAEEFDPETLGVQSSEDGTGVDHYAKKSFHTVRPGDVLGIVHLATPGTDGQNVRGECIAAKPGTPLGLKIDPSISVADDGVLTAQTDGLIRLQDGFLTIDPVLEISGAVSFSTGNVEFRGDVVIRDGVRDRFAVNAEGNVTIEGFIDASTIKCGRHLSARLGIAGRDEGTIDVAGEARVGYLDRVHGQVGADLTISRALMHCNLRVGGNLVAESASIIGGNTVVTGDAAVGEIGSAAEVPTSITLSASCDPREQRVAELRTSIRDAKSTLNTLSADGARSESDADRIQAITASITELQDLLDEALADTQTPVSEDDESIDGPSLTVTRRINANVTLRFGEHGVLFRDSVSGPLRIWSDREGSIQCAIKDGTPLPVTSIACVSVAA